MLREDFFVFFSLFKYNIIFFPWCFVAGIFYKKSFKITVYFLITQCKSMIDQPHGKIGLNGQYNINKIHESRMHFHLITAGISLNVWSENFTFFIHAIIQVQTV